MKRKSRFYAEKTKILNKPGRYIVIRQWSDFGALTSDDNSGQGFDIEEAIALVNQHNQLNKAT